MEHVAVKQNRRLLLDEHHHLSISEGAIPEPGPGEVLVRIRANGICGSDIHFFREGRLGPFVVDRPYVPGHEACGEVVSAGAGAVRFRTGDAVVIEPGIPCGRCPVCRSGRYNLCPDVSFLSAPPVDGTFCDYLTVREDALWPMPAGMTWETAALAEPSAVAVHAVRRARFAPGATAVVVGAGPIGLLVLQAFRAAGGGPVTCIDLQEQRLAMAVQLGAARYDPSGQNCFDVVFDTTGSAKACSGLFDLAKPGGCVVQVGWPAGDRVTMNIAMMIDKELDYVAVNRYANAFPVALQWLAEGKIQASVLITQVFPFSQAAEAFSFAAEHPDKTIKVIVVNEP